MTTTEQAAFDEVNVTRETLVKALADDVEEAPPAPKTRAFVAAIEGFVRAVARHEASRAKPARKPRVKNPDAVQFNCAVCQKPGMWVPGVLTPPGPVARHCRDCEPKTTPNFGPYDTESR